MAEPPADEVDQLSMALSTQQISDFPPDLKKTFADEEKNYIAYFMKTHPTTLRGLCRSFVRRVADGQADGAPVTPQEVAYYQLAACYLLLVYGVLTLESDAVEADEEAMEKLVIPLWLLVLATGEAIGSSATKMEGCTSYADTHLFVNCIYRRLGPILGLSNLKVAQLRSANRFGTTDDTSKNVYLSMAEANRYLLTAQPQGQDAVRTLCRIRNMRDSLVKSYAVLDAALPCLESMGCVGGACTDLLEAVDLVLRATEGEEVSTKLREVLVNLKDTAEDLSAARAQQDLFIKQQATPKLTGLPLALRSLHHTPTQQRNALTFYKPPGRQGPPPLPERAEPTV